MSNDIKSMRGFAFGSICLILIFAASAAPIPLYGNYCNALAIPKSSLSIATVAYFAGTIGSILVFARLSNYSGRKPAMYLAIGFSIAGCLMFACLSSELMLYAGRFTQGLACGIAAGSAGAYVVDNAPTKPTWIAAMVTTSGPQAGLTIGCLMAAGFADIDALDPTWAFLILATTFVICAICLAFCPETVEKQHGALRSMTPSISIPAEVKKILPVCCLAFMGTWAIGGLFQASSTTFSRICLGSDSTLFSALVFAAFMAPSLIGPPLTARLSARQAQIVGMGSFTGCIAGLAVSISLGNAGLLLFSSVLGSIAQGAAYSGGMRQVLAKTTLTQNAPVLSTVTMLSYLGAALPNLLIGILGEGWDIVHIVDGYLIGVALCFVASVVFLRKGFTTNQSNRKELSYEQ